MATLEQRDLYERHLYTLAVRIDTDGDEHYLRFRQMKEVLAKYNTGEGLLAYLRPVEVGTEEQARHALDIFDNVKEGLHDAYVAEAGKDYPEAQDYLSQVRAEMKVLRDEGKKLAADQIGIPFWPDHVP